MRYHDTIWICTMWCCDVERYLEEFEVDRSIIIIDINSAKTERSIFNYSFTNCKLNRNKKFEIHPFL